MASNLASNLANVKYVSAEALEDGALQQGDFQERAGARLEALLEDIRNDASRDSARYLRETIVPEGGE